MPYAVIARYECKPQDVPTIRAALIAMRDETWREPANIEYVVHLEHEAEPAFLLYEQYVDRAGFDAHLASPHFDKHIVRVVRPLLTGRTVHFAEVL